MAANVVLSFNQITFRTGLLLSLRIEKLYHVNDHKSANRVGIAVFSSGQLSQVAAQCSAISDVGSHFRDRL
jgi:hypothetical protein